MEFRDLQRQYQILKQEIDAKIKQVLTEGNYISGFQVLELEKVLAEYVGVKHCITCGNGTDALSLALMVWDIKPGDAVFVPDFTFFASAEVVAYVGATPIFVDVEEDTFNMSVESLEKAIMAVLEEGRLVPRAIIAVDLFGQPADCPKIQEIAAKYHLLVLEDGAQGFGGKIGERRACSFGDISTTSFFPAKPLGCYGDGGAIFTDNEEWAELLRSYRVHGKGKDKYDNVHIGMNSRLDTLQAAVLGVKLDAFKKYELESVNRVAARYTRELEEIVKVPYVKAGYYSSWAQYSVLLRDESSRNGLRTFLKERGIPSMVYYPKTMSQQMAFRGGDVVKTELNMAKELCGRVLALPMHPYMEMGEQDKVIGAVWDFLT